MMTTNPVRRDAGFSLTELLFVVGLLSFVLAAAWGVSSAMVKGGEVNETQSVFARDSGEPLRIVNKAIMQAVEVEGTYCTDQAMQMLIDPTMNSQFQRVRVSATSDGYLHYEVWQLTSSKTVVSKVRDVRFSDKHVSNITQGIPLFTYYNSSGAVITDRALLGSDTRSVMVQLALTANGASAVSSQTVMLRNMQQ